MSVTTCEVLVVGAGLGGVAAALAAVEQGAEVILTEELSGIGGQLTTQLVPCPDEHPLIEYGGCTRSYAALRAAMRAEYGGVANPGGGWVSRVCVEPAVAERVLQRMLAPHLAGGRLRLHTRWSPHAVRTEGSSIREVGFEDAHGDEQRVRAAVVVDATELGDVLPLAGVPWAIGSEGYAAHQEPHALAEGADPTAEQSCTWVVALELGRAGAAGPMPPPPAGYAALRGAQPFSLTLRGHDGTGQTYRMFERGPGGAEPFWTYRRIRDASQDRGADVATINWAGNDYAGAGLVGSPHAARAGARRLTESFVHWLRTEVPRDDGGHGYPELRPAEEVTGAPHGMAVAPYVRESRRIATVDPLTVHDLLPREGAARARGFTDSVAIGWYHADVHRRVGHPEDAYLPTAPFHIPARALVSPAVTNLVAGAKNLAATQMAAAATRVHPVEWAIGEAAGVLAAIGCQGSRAPAALARSTVGVLELQWRLAVRGAPLTWALDLEDDDAAAPAAQLLAVHGALVGRRTASLDLDLDGPCDDRDRLALSAAAQRLGVARDPIASAQRAWRAAAETVAAQWGRSGAEER